jgi:hypothetical protein
LTKSTTITISTKTQVAFLQQLQKMGLFGAFQPQVRAPQTESMGEGLGVLPVKEAI